VWGGGGGGVVGGGWGGGGGVVGGGGGGGGGVVRREEGRCAGFLSVLSLPLVFSCYGGLWVFFFGEFNS